MKTLIISPKPKFPGLPQFPRLDASEISLSLAQPEGSNLANHVYAFILILSNLLGLVFGTVLLSAAAEIALQQLEHYIKSTGEQVELCLKDIAESLRSVPAKGFRKGGYKDAAETGLELLLGKQNLFACRKGLSIKWLMQQNAILHTHNLTNTIQCQVLLIYILYWCYRDAKFGGYGKKLRYVIIVDDASRYIGSMGSQFERQSITSELGHILAVLREAGVAVIFVTQLPAQVDPAVLSLMRTVIAIGNINGEENLRVLKSCMSLNEDQKTTIARAKNREAFVSIPDFPWPKPIHGWTPYVSIS